ncbi:MAG: hypothetical protein LBD56_00130 [Endomicrobium sp.]|jgi:hypothetical protein|nr:hypothetical protein [Endomicrobium sp.]
MSKDLKKTVFPLRNGFILELLLKKTVITSYIKLKIDDKDLAVLLGIINIAAIVAK